MHRRPFFNPFNLSTQSLLAVLFVIALWLGGLHAFTRDIDSAAANGPLPTVDAIVVLTGGSNRLQTGFDLLRQNLGKKLFISGVYQGVEVRELLALIGPSADQTASERVVLGFEANNTVGNARETAAWLKLEGYTQFYLVTANYHLKRAALEFKMLAPDLVALPLPVTPEGLDMANWWRNDQHRSLIIREYMKYLFTLFRYTITVRAS